MKSVIYYKRNKDLYELRQAPVQWFLKLKDTLMIGLKYRQLNCDGSAFMKGSLSFNNGTITLCYVDDLVFISSTEVKLKRYVEEFLETFRGSKEALRWYWRRRWHHRVLTELLHQTSFGVIWLDKCIYSYDSENLQLLWWSWNSQGRSYLRQWSVSEHDLHFAIPGIKGSTWHYYCCGDTISVRHGPKRLLGEILEKSIRVPQTYNWFWIGTQSQKYSQATIVWSRRRYDSNQVFSDFNHAGDKGSRKSRSGSVWLFEWLPIRLVKFDIDIECFLNCRSRVYRHGRIY